MNPMASPRPRFSSRGGFVKSYMPKEYMNWKKQFLLAWSVYQAEKIEQGIPLIVTLTFYIQPPSAFSKVKKNASVLDSESMPVIKKPDIDNLQKSVLDALNGYAWHDDNQISDIYARKRYSLRPRIEVEIMEV
ncbi:RusA family crossover junction endodeoxyribonuclease [Lactococcus taiwanensis]|uniref:RusA family crossover junction endodeoxyribonuclease n=1 Tax=Lactococcus taiwanensis TaxID=1151742 RepID=UPI001966707D|nr:RusA family crossover junction endodeoxyribonuclease [Lactococcus taiwanensis]QRZ11754.1 RusA family crossover junction endodeoxyribonuclease [Lactococcus taiwanensis]